MTTAPDTIEQLAGAEYKYGFVTDVDTEIAPPGLNEDTVRRISATKQEPEWLLEWRLKALRTWLKMENRATWANLRYPAIDFQAISYYAAPKPKKQLNSLDEVDPEVREAFNKLGISLDEQKRLTNVAVDAVFDSVSVATTFRETLSKLGIIFGSFSDAV
ncbi:MAG: Fe-S cluster assembly protein SufB, partial [Armatimonadetes bacterium]|nr:Fe-S cluster assembly protein SufB [Armatimonadota bacterium]